MSEKNTLEILVIDDEPDIRSLICDILKDEGYASIPAANSSETFKILEEKLPSVVVLDIWLQGSELDGIGILEILKKRYPLLPVIIISGHGTLETAINAIKLGAYDYLEKPFTADKLIIAVKRAYEETKLKRENIYLKSKIINNNEFVGSSKIVSKLKKEIEKLALINNRLIIYGEIGTGKELIARMLHKNSKRANANFVTFNPTCLSSDVVMQELFGEKIFHPNEKMRKISAIESANRGTLYIDEIGNLPTEAQERLLQFIYNNTIEKAEKTIKLDVRIICSSSQDLKNPAKNFNQDLYNRVNINNLKAPALSERKEDIPLLVEYFTKQFTKVSGLKYRKFSEEAILRLQMYNWPGNIRQLKNVIELVLLMNPIYSKDDQIINVNMLPYEIINNITSKSDGQTSIESYVGSLPLKEAREEFEKMYLSQVLKRYGGNISQAASFIKMERSALHRKLKSLKISTSKDKQKELAC